MPAASAGGAPAVTEVRARIRAVAEREANASPSRPVVVLAVDGIGCDVARRAWRDAAVEELASVFPTTSSTAWLSSLSGMSVAAHGVPGVVFSVPEHGPDPVNVFEYQGPLMDGAGGNVFEDAAALGYLPVSVAGDLEDLDCAWRTLLLQHSHRVAGPRIYTPPGARPDAAAVGRLARESIEAVLGSHPRGVPRLIWWFMDLDLHVHRHGYDEHVHDVLVELGRLAGELVERGCVVLAHSDHGLTPTEHDPDLEAVLGAVSARHGCRVGGAGRCRWLYAPASRDQAVRDELESSLPAGVSLFAADELFAPGSLARRRVGANVLVATGNRFLAQPGYTHDHGSRTPAEVAVPFAEWRR